MLTLSRDYFRLRKPLERRIYELARKHCGRQPEWRVSIDTLLKKSGSASPRRVFRKMIRDMIVADHLPQYALSEEPGDIIRVSRRGGEVLEGVTRPMLSSDAIERARRLAPGLDVYALEVDWLAFWVASGRKPLRSPDKAFLGYVAKREKSNSS